MGAYSLSKMIALVVSLIKRARPVPPATKTKAYVIKMLKEDILAHEAMIGHIIENPTYISWYGDESHHLKWISVFSNAVIYLGRLK